MVSASLKIYPAWFARLLRPRFYLECSKRVVEEEEDYFCISRDFEIRMPEGIESRWHFSAGRFICLRV
jgi:hypothetical protein